MAMASDQKKDHNGLEKARELRQAATEKKQLYYIGDRGVNPITCHIWLMVNWSGAPSWRGVFIINKS